MKTTFILLTLALAFLSSVAFAKQEAYEISIHTANKDHADTDAGYFYLKIQGARGDSKNFELDNSGDDRQRAAVDKYTIIVKKNIGQVQRIRIWHDNSAKGDDGWLLDKVTVKNLSSGSSWKFSCNRWLDADGVSKIAVNLIPGKRCFYDG